VPSEPGPHHDETCTRRGILLRGGRGVALLGGALWATSVVAGCARRATSSTDGPLRNIVISTEENRSFDHYYGYAPQVQAAGFGPPPGYTQPGLDGVGHAPFELRSLAPADPPHQWDPTHRQWNGGGMDGAGPVVAGGMLFVNSGYGGLVGRPGNVLLAFGLE